jgi:E3 ubiquitin-protein ligase EDD1
VAGVGGSFEGGTPPPEPAQDATAEDVPLFFCPGKKGFYSPRFGRWGRERINAYRNVGR